MNFSYVEKAISVEIGFINLIINFYASLPHQTLEIEYINQMVEFDNKRNWL